MIHLTDSQLNEYLDEALDEATGRSLEAHLRSCYDCRSRLGQLQAVFRILVDLSDASPSRDLTASVMAHLPGRHAHTWTRALAAQLGVVAGAFTFIALKAVQIIRIPTLPSLDLPQLSLAQLQFLVSYSPLLMLHFQFSIPIPPSAAPVPSFPALGLQSAILKHLLSIPGFAQPPAAALSNSMVVAAVFALCLASNLLLLRKTRG